MSHYAAAMKNYFGFSGRARRAEFWMFGLFFAIFYIISIAISVAIHNMVLVALVVLVHIIPMLAVTWRRLHDTNRSGGFYFLGLIPLIGAIVLLVFYCTEGTAGPNQYGPDPKNPNAPMQGGGYQYV